MNVSAERFASEWIEAWNRHELEAILGHYDERIRFRSPFVVQLLGDPSGLIEGKSRLRPYFETGLRKFPNLRFELEQVYPGVDSVVLCYRSVRNLRAAELMRFGASGKVVEASAHYAPAPQERRTD